MDDCIFCKIIKGDIPALKIYEDNEFLAFLDIEPLNRGHVLLVPKTHYRWVYDVPSSGRYWSLATDLSKKIISSLNADYASFITAGMDVPHAHIHIIPRYLNDHLSNMFDAYRLKYTQDDLAQIQSLITSDTQK